MNKVAYVAAFDFDNAEAAKNRFLSLCDVLEKNFQVTKVLTTYPIDKLYDDKTENWKIRFVKNKSINIGNGFNGGYIFYKKMLFP